MEWLRVLRWGLRISPDCCVCVGEGGGKKGGDSHLIVVGGGGDSHLIAASWEGVLT